MQLDLAAVWRLVQISLECCYNMGTKSGDPLRLYHTRPRQSKHRKSGRTTATTARQQQEDDEEEHHLPPRWFLNRHAVDRSTSDDDEEEEEEDFDNTNNHQFNSNINNNNKNTNNNSATTTTVRSDNRKRCYDDYGEADKDNIVWHVPKGTVCVEEMYDQHTRILAFRECCLVHFRTIVMHTLDSCPPFDMSTVLLIMQYVAPTPLDARIGAVLEWRNIGKTQRREFTTSGENYTLDGMRTVCRALEERAGKRCFKFLRQQLHLRHDGRVLAMASAFDASALISRERCGVESCVYCLPSLLDGETIVSNHSIEKLLLTTPRIGGSQEQTGSRPVIVEASSVAIAHAATVAVAAPTSRPVGPTATTANMIIEKESKNASYDWDGYRLANSGVDFRSCSGGSREQMALNVELAQKYCVDDIQTLTFVRHVWNVPTAEIVSLYIDRLGKLAFCTDVT